jgi:hypothetical protein
MELPNGYDNMDEDGKKYILTHSVPDICINASYVFEKHHFVTKLCC